MKYIISEIKFNKVINELLIDYLDSFLQANVFYESDPYKIIEEPNSEAEWNEQYMEYDRTDGRLWISRHFMNLFLRTFPFAKDIAQNLIKEWFEDNFDVDVKYVEVSG